MLQLVKSVEHQQYSPPRQPTQLPQLTQVVAQQQRLR